MPGQSWEGRGIGVSLPCHPSTGAAAQGPFMPIDSVETLLSVLRRAQILTPEQVAEVVGELGGVYREPQPLGEYLVQIDWLTAYQLQLLLSERWNELTVGPYQVLDQLGEGGVSEVFKAWDT